MNPRVRAQRVFSRLTDIVHSAGMLALATRDGTGLLVHTEQLTDVSLLPFAAEVTARYFQPQAGDIFILNDPYSGGSGLSQLTVVGAVGAEFLAVSRLRLQPQLKLTRDINQEGVRIPPTPLINHGQVNLGILDALRAHPLVAADFATRVPPFIEMFRGQLSKLIDSPTFHSLQTANTFEALDMSVNDFREQLREVPAAEAVDEVVLEDKSRIRLRTTIKNGEVIFDFSGTSPASDFALTDRATAGICLSTVLAALDWQGPVHSKLFDCVKVQTPVASMVNAKFPASLALGLGDGAGLISNLVLKTLRHIAKSLSRAEANPSRCEFTLNFGNSIYYDAIVGGGAASGSAAGGDAIASCGGKSLEQLESAFPLRFHALHFRKSSSGFGQFAGGLGQTRMIEVLKPATLNWQFLAYNHKPEGVLGGKPGTLPEIAVLKSGAHELQALPWAGEVQLAAGDRVVIQSGGAGGYGEPTTEEDAN